MIKEELASKIYSLSKAILEDIKEFKIDTIKRQYIKLKIDNSGNSTYSKRQETIVKEELSSRDISKFLESIKENPEYAPVLSYISKKYNLDDIPASICLNFFMTNLLFERTSETGWNYRNDITDGILVECIALFIGDLEGNPPIWNVTLWIEGISITQKYKISENLLIRNVEISDRELEMPFDSVLLNDSFPDTPNESAAILELKIKCNQKDTWNEVDIILTSLMLLRLGSVYSKKATFRPNSFLNFPQSSWSNISYSTNYRYNIKNEDAANILEIIAILKNKWILISDKLNPIHIALERYSHALLDPEGIEGRITSAINCLEALYLKKDERAELSHRLGQRVSAILRILDFAPIESYNSLTRAYDVRSNYIHGQIEPEKHKDASKLGEKIIDYARLSIIVFIQLTSDYSKEELINKIDRSLLDEHVFNSLKDIIIKHCKIYR
jgi:hypothetical protein